MTSLVPKRKNLRRKAEIANLRDLAKEISVREGKKKQLSIAQISEVVSVLSEIFVEQLDFGLKIRDMLVKNGSRRNRNRQSRS